MPNKPWPQTWRNPGGLNPFTSDKDIVDHQVVTLEYENGVLATFHTNLHRAIPERRLLLLGTEGAIRADLVSGTIECRRIGFDTPLERIPIEITGHHAGGDEGLAIELAACMRGEEPPSGGLPEALISAVACFAIDEALATGMVIDLAPRWTQVDAALAPQNSSRA